MREDLDGRLCLGAWREETWTPASLISDYLWGLLVPLQPATWLSVLELNAFYQAADWENIEIENWCFIWTNPNTWWEGMATMPWLSHSLFFFFLSSPHGGFSNSAHILNCTQKPWSLSVSLCLCFDGLSTPIIYSVLSEWPGWQHCVSTLLINNDQIHHSPQLENDIVLTCQCSLFLWNFE